MTKFYDNSAFFLPRFKLATQIIHYLHSACVMLIGSLISIYGTDKTNVMEYVMTALMILIMIMAGMNKQVSQMRAPLAACRKPTRV